MLLTLKPSITSEEAIILDPLQAELIDFESWMGELVSPPLISDIQAPDFAIANPSPVEPLGASATLSRL